MPQVPAEQLAAFSRLLYERRLVVATQGNLSVRTGRNMILITPAKKSKRGLQAEDMVALALSGRKIAGRYAPSSEYRLHLAVYHARPDVKAICHAHPPYATAIGFADLDPTAQLWLEAGELDGTVAWIPYTKPGSLALARRAAGTIGNHQVLLLQRHGVVAVGPDIETAFLRLETVEHAAFLAWATQVIKTDRCQRAFVAKGIRTTPKNPSRFVNRHAGSGR